MQGYQHEALVRAATLLDALGEPATGLRAAADALAARFRDRFWLTDARGRYPALALDGTKRAVDSPASNMGHLLDTGLLDGDEADAVGARLLAPDLAAGYGLRTMSGETGGYSPLSYHCGSVWPHDTAIAIRGLMRVGQNERAAELAAQLLRAGGAFGWRVPELFAGYGPDEVAAPVPYPTSCRPQAWSAAAAITVVEAFLGLTVDVPGRTITVRPPRPNPVGAIEVDGLVLPGGTLSVSIGRDGTVLAVDAPAGFEVLT